MIGGKRKAFKIMSLGWLENDIFRLIFANTEFCKSAILLLFAAEFTRNVLDIHWYPECTIGPTLVRPEDNLYFKHFSYKCIEFR